MNEQQSEASKARPGRKPSPEKREAILDAALKLFAGRGVDATTTRTLFKHFGSKDRLVQAVIERISIDMVRQTGFRRLEERSPMSAAEFAAWHRDFLRERIVTAARSPQNYRVLFRELFRDDAFRESYRERWMQGVFEPMVRQLGAMQRAGRISSTRSPAALAAAHYSLNIGYLVTRFVLAPANDWQTERDVEIISSLFMAACQEK
jgi:AcrR family transcriptional regulator